MKLPELKYPRREDLQDAPKGVYLQRLLDAINGNARAFEQVLSGNASTADQTPNRVVTVKLTHGGEQLIANPFTGKRKVVGAWPIACDGGQRVLGTPSIRNATKGNIPQIGVTAYFAPAVESVSSFLASASAVALVSATPANVLSISLTAGEWDISALALFYTAGVTGTRLIAGVSPTSVTLPPLLGDAGADTPTMPTVNSDNFVAIPSYRVLLTTTTTYYLVSQAHFTAGNVVAFGRISARRMNIDLATQANVTLYLFTE